MSLWYSDDLSRWYQDRYVTLSRSRWIQVIPRESDEIDSEPKEDPLQKIGDLLFICDML